MSREPEALRCGKEFHQRIQEEWLGSAQGVVLPEWSVVKPDGRRGRVDVFVDRAGDGVVSVVEVKASDWDAMSARAVRRNALRHARQVWAYVESQLGGADVCPGIIYRRRPRTLGRLEQVEGILGGQGMQVVWHDESKEELRKRLELRSAYSKDR